MKFNYQDGTLAPLDEFPFNTHQSSFARFNPIIVRVLATAGFDNLPWGKPPLASANPRRVFYGVGDEIDLGEGGHHDAGTMVKALYGYPVSLLSPSCKATCDGQEAMFVSQMD